MWLFTTQGFFSAVAHRDDPRTILVRARVRDDAQRLVEAAGEGEVIETPDADYRFRVELPRQDWVAYVADSANAIDYPSYKDAVARRQGRERAHVYTDVWSVMLRLQRDFLAR